VLNTKEGTMNTQVRRYVTELRNDPEPTRRALAMLLAIKQHLADVLDDDPGDADSARPFEDAATYMLSVEDAIRAAIRRVR
jgi:hypothetical protein